MVSSLQPTLANIFLCFDEQAWLNNYPIELKPTVYRRYANAGVQLKGTEETSPVFFS